MTPLKEIKYSFEPTGDKNSVTIFGTVLKADEAIQHFILNENQQGVQINADVDGVSLVVRYNDDHLSTHSVYYNADDLSDFIRDDIDPALPNMDVDLPGTSSLNFL